MIRISLPYIWSLCDVLDVLSRLDHTKDADKFDFALELFRPQYALEALLQGSVFAPTLRSSRPLAAELLRLMHEFTNADVGKLTGNVLRNEIWAIRDAYGQFKTAFLAELGTFPAYFVTQKGDRDTLTLLDQPLRMFPDDLAAKVPEAKYDIAEAGKALCFEVATACGYHVFRATEAVLRRYYSHVTNGRAHPKVRNIMVYVNAMRQTKVGDERILAAIAQLSTLHRNPLAHPEVALSLDEAISLLGMARSVVTAMLMVLPVLPQTTGGAPPGNA